MTRFISFAHLLMILLISILADTPTMAFVAPQSIKGANTAPRIISRLFVSKNNKSKNAVDEILDALDTMLGVSPLAETDLKAVDSSSAELVDLQQRATQREKGAPPSDALSKTSVNVFFFFLGLVPVVSLFAAVQWGGVKPFNL